MHGDLESGVKASPNCTLRRAAQDWLAGGLEGRSAKTVKKNVSRGQYTVPVTTLRSRT